MSNFSFEVFLKAFSDGRSSNAPSLENFSWDRSANGVFVNSPLSQGFTLAPGENRTLFSGLRTINQDGTTQYSISLVPGTTNTYQLAWTGGTAPDFRTPRVTGADATTQVTVTLNGPLATYTSTGGTPFSLVSGGVIVGDYTTIGTGIFNIANQGPFQIVALTPTSFTVVNDAGVAEGPLTLGSGFATQVQIYSASGVQTNDTLVISSGFSTVTQGSYIVGAVTAESLQFTITGVLPTEGPITTEVAIYTMAKRLVYLESDQPVLLSINGIAMASPSLTPFVVQQCPNTAFLNPTGPGSFNANGSSSGGAKPGMFLLTATVWSMTVTNLSSEVANLILITVQ